MDKYSDADSKKRYACRRYHALTGLAIDAVISMEAFEMDDKEKEKGEEKDMKKMVRSDHIRYTSPIRRSNTHVVRAPNSPRKGWNPFNIGDDEHHHRNEGQYYQTVMDQYGDADSKMRYAIGRYHSITGWAIKSVKLREAVEVSEKEERERNRKRDMWVGGHLGKKLVS